MADPARLDELRRQFEEDPRRYFAPLASALRRAGDAPAAVALARAQLGHYPGHLTGHVILGQALLDVGDARGARDAFARAAALDAGNVVALQQLVTLARAADDPGDARYWTDRLVEADPELAGELAVDASEPAFEALELEDAGAMSTGFAAATLDPRLAIDVAPATPSAPAPPAPAPPAWDPVGDVRDDAPASAGDADRVEAATVAGDTAHDIAAPDVAPPNVVDPPAARWTSEADAAFESGPPFEPGATFEPFAADDAIAAPDVSPADDPVAAPDAAARPGDALALAAPDPASAIGSPSADVTWSTPRDDGDAAGGPAGAEPLDPVVGLDLAPADPVPLPMREAWPELVGDEVSGDDLSGDDRSGDDLAAGGDAPEPVAAEPTGAIPGAVPPPAAPFVTETMAALLLAQGHAAQAVDVFERLVARHPDDARLRARLVEARATLGVPAAGDPDGAPAFATPEPAPSGATALEPAPSASGRTEEPAGAVPAASAPESAAPSIAAPATDPPPTADATGAPSTVDAPDVPDAPDAPAAPSADERAARMWRTAFAAMAPAPAPVDHPAAGDPLPGHVRPATPSLAAPVIPVPAADFDDLSFEHFFADAPVVEPVGDFDRWAADAERVGAMATDPATAASAALPDPSASPVSTSIAPPAAPDAQSLAADDPDEDLAQFNAWLRGLAE